MTPRAARNLARTWLPIAELALGIVLAFTIETAAGGLSFWARTGIILAPLVTGAAAVNDRAARYLTRKITERRSAT